ncbi:TPA: hypothetical protein HA231_04525 [Candidatus Woesearchaeota archaeon]|nr:hypothetical protein [Candidatus Woesearchaeota archaeon]
MFEHLLLSQLDITNSGVLSALAFAVAITALSFMFGEAFSMPSLKAFAKNEAYEMGVSVVIVLIALLLIMPGGAFDLIGQGFMLRECAIGESQPGCVPRGQACQEYLRLHPYDPISNTFQGGSRVHAQADFFLGCRPSINPLDLSVIGSEGVVTRKLISGYTSLMITEMAIGLMSGLATSVQMPIPFMPLLKIDVGLVPMIGMSQINDIHTLIVDLVGQLLSAFFVQKLLLVFIDETALAVFLPFGLLLRAFPFSRKTGSTIVAVVFAMSFVYPISILINQQIWESITNPTSNPNTPPGTDCKALGETCSADYDCCSDDCRYSQKSAERKCVSQLTDFSDYKSVYALCYDAYGGDDINEILEEEGAIYDEGFNNVYFPVGGSATNTQWTKTEGRLRDFSQELVRKAQAGLTVIQAMAYMNPVKVLTTSFAMVELLVMDVSQFAILALLFIVIEIIITLTLLKDFALLIGGEARILGISQLV